MSDNNTDEPPRPGSLMRAPYIPATLDHPPLPENPYTFLLLTFAVLVPQPRIPLPTSAD